MREKTYRRSLDYSELTVLESSVIFFPSESIGLSDNKVSDYIERTNLHWKQGDNHHKSRDRVPKTILYLQSFSKCGKELQMCVLNVSLMWQILKEHELWFFG